jgi:SAM-dependent methyltransferase
VPSASDGERATAAERTRLEAVYRERDAASASSPYTFADPAYVLGMHELEWALLAALRSAGAPLAGSVLDVGCGSGYFLQRLRDYGVSEAVGVELVPERAEEARRRYPGLDVRHGDASALPFADGRFDLVTQFTVFSSILDPAVRAAVAAEMWRVTRPGGFVVSVDMLPTPALRRAVQALRRTGRAAAATPVQGLSAEDVARLFGTAPATVRRFGYHLGAGPLLARSRLAAQAVVSLRLAQTHLVAVFAKPGR